MTSLRSQHLIAVFTAALVLCTGWPHPAHAQQTIVGYCVSDIDASSWPTVRMRLRVVDVNGEFISGLTSVPVFEAGETQAADVTMAQQDGALAHIFVVDGGKTPSTATKQVMQRAISQLADSGSFRESLGDSVNVRVLANTGTSKASPASVVKLAWVTRSIDIVNFASTVFFTTNSAPTKGLEALEDTLRDVEARLGSSMRAPAVIYFLSNRIEGANSDPEQNARDWAAKLRNQGIAIFAFQTSATNSAPIKALSGNDRYLQVTAKNLTLLDQMYSRADQQRAFYAVSYTSKLDGDAPRRITVGKANTPGACAEDTYQPSAEKPRVEFDNLPETLSFSNETTQHPISVKVIWPDGKTRPIRSSNLLVNGVRYPGGTAVADGSAVTFALKDLQVLDQTRVELKAELEDDAGRRFTSASKSVAIAHTKPSSASPADANPAPTPVVVEPGLSWPVAAAGALAIAGIAGAGAFLFARRSRSARPSSTGLSDTVLASLSILEGPHGRRGEKIKLTKPRYVIGRQGADIVFFADAERSSISRSHCTLTRDADMGFWITDNASSNGTRVNGRIVPPSEKIPLNNGDQIQLGNPDKNGALLLFSLDHPTQFVRAPSGNTGTLK